MAAAIDLFTSAILLELMRREGGAVDHPADKGGPTYRGVTLARAQLKWPKITFEELQKKTDDELLEFYWFDYVVAHNFHFIDDAQLRAFTIDFAVHSGPEAAIQALQVATGVDTPNNLQPDKVGPMTLAAIRRSDAKQLYRSVFLQRWLKLDNLSLRNPVVLAFVQACARKPETVAALLGVTPKQVQGCQLVFAFGWNNRLRELFPQA